MKYYNKTSQRDKKQERSENRKTKKFMPKYTVGSTLQGGDVSPCSDKERRMRQIESSIRMNKNKIGRIFSIFNQEQLKSPDVLKPNKDDEL